MAAFFAAALAFLAALNALALAINLSVFEAFFLSFAAIAFLFFSNAFYFLIFFKPLGTAFLGLGPNFFDFFNFLATPDFFFFLLKLKQDFMTQLILEREKFLLFH